MSAAAQAVTWRELERRKLLDMPKLTLAGAPVPAEIESGATGMRGARQGERRAIALQLLVSCVRSAISSPGTTRRFAAPGLRALTQLALNYWRIRCPPKSTRSTVRICWRV